MYNYIYIALVIGDFQYSTYIHVRLVCVYAVALKGTLHNWIQ